MEVPWWFSGKEFAYNARNAVDTGLILGLGRSHAGGNATHSSTLAWRIPWTEVPGGLQSMGHKELDMTEATEHICTRITYVLCRLIKYEIYHNIHQ